MVEFIEVAFFGGTNLLLAAAILLLCAVIGGAVFLVHRDVARRPEESWISIVKEWQSTLGAILGFLSAAGVLIISSELQANQRAAESARAGQAIGYGLALEAEQISNSVATAVTLSKMIQSQPPTDYGRVCTNYLAMLQRLLPTRTIVYDAVLNHLVDFGDDNLSVFIRFYSSYSDLLQEVRAFDTNQCALNGESEVILIREKLDSLLSINGMIAENYGTLPPDEMLETAEEQSSEAPAEPEAQPEAPASQGATP